MLGAGNPEAIQYVAICNETSGMPGMATNEEMNRLRALEGEAFRVAFLQLMIRHHQGALPMARFAAVYAENRLVKNLARRMALAQREEIIRMVYLLKQAGADPLATPLGAVPIFADSSSQ